jgi:serine/threonine protein kinase
MNDSLEQLSKSQLFDLKGQILEGTIKTGSGSLGPRQGADHLNGTIIDQKYKIIGLLGEGGMGAVYKAHHLMLNKDVALKTFRSANFDDESLKRFHREAQAIARLSHLNIVQVFDFGVGEDNIPYYTMECLTGESLADRLKANGPLPLDQTIRLFLQVCQGLTAAHSKGIIHRDLKPANIFLARETSAAGPVDLVKIVDFGVAGLSAMSLDGQKLTTTGSIFGSPLYMSPEQSLGNPVTEKSDIYSCGCALFETLTGSPPFCGENAFATMLQHQLNPVPKLRDLAQGQEFPQRVTALLDRMLAKSEDQRFQSFDGVAAELEEISQLHTSAHQGRQQESAQQPTNQPWAKIPDLVDPPRAKGKPLAVAGTIALLVAGVSVFPWSRLKPYAAKLASEAVVRPALQPDSTGIGVPPALKTATPGRNIQPYLQNPEAGSNQTSRRFVFPNDQSLGILRWPSMVPGGQPGESLAQGTVIVPQQSGMTLEASEALSRNPELFKGFGAPDLTSLNLPASHDWRDKHMKYVGALTGLLLLNIEGTDITDDCIEDLNKLKNLVYLAATDASWSGKRLAQLEQLPKLRSILVSHNRYFSEVLKKLKGGQTMQTIQANDCNLSDSDMKIIATMPNLLALDVSENPSITDAGVESICHLQKLQILNLRKTAVTSDCVPFLKRAPVLIQLKISSSKWGADEQKRLRAAIPNCKIDSEVELNIDDIRKSVKEHGIQ